MRTIKFRVWDGKKFLSASDKEYEYCIEGLVNNPIRARRRFLGESDGIIKNAIIQQFTGLQDSTGKEIYEGDIVEFFSGEPNGNGRSFYKNKVEVKYENGAFWPRPMKEECGDSYYDYELKDLKILGNIFETPELLNK